MDADRSSGEAPGVGPVPPALPPDVFFTALEQRRVQALLSRDMPTLWALHAPHYQLITPAGRSFDRDRYLAAIAAGDLAYLRWDIGATQVRASAGMVILRYQATLELDGGGGRGTPFVCWHTDSYEGFGASWQAVWSQATAIRLPDGR